jgi:hypothetical protein
MPWVSAIGLPVSIRTLNKRVLLDRRHRNTRDDIQGCARKNSQCPAWAGQVRVIFPSWTI